jgi:hypothetical protein
MIATRVQTVASPIVDLAGSPATALSLVSWWSVGPAAYKEVGPCAEAPRSPGEGSTPPRSDNHWRSGAPLQDSRLE